MYVCVCEREREIQLLCVSCVVNTNKGFSKPLQTEMKVLSSFSLLILCQFASLQSTCTGQKSWSWPNRMRLPELLRCTCSSHCLPLRLGFFFSQVGVASEKRRGDVNNRWRWKARDRPISYIYRYCIFRWGTAAVHCPFRRFFLPSFFILFDCRARKRPKLSLSHLPESLIGSAPFRAGAAASLKHKHTLLFIVWGERYGRAIVSFSSVFVLSANERQQQLGRWYCRR